MRSGWIAVAFVMTGMLTCCAQRGAREQVLEFWNGAHLCVPPGIIIAPNVTSQRRHHGRPFEYRIEVNSTELSVKAIDDAEEIDLRSVIEFARSHPAASREVDAGRIVALNVGIRREGRGSERRDAIVPGNGIRSVLLARSLVRQSEEDQGESDDDAGFYALCVRNSEGKTECERAIRTRSLLVTYRFSPEQIGLRERDQEIKMWLTDRLRSCAP